MLMNFIVGFKKGIVNLSIVIMMLIGVIGMGYSFVNLLQIDKTQKRIEFLVEFNQAKKDVESGAVGLKEYGARMNGKLAVYRAKGFFSNIEFIDLTGGKF